MGTKLLTVFNRELSRIRNDDARSITKDLLNQGSDDFLKWASSSTGKYHPPDETGKIGMVLHVKRCAALATDASRMYELTTIENDALVAGCLVHDLWKRGANNDAEHTSKDHMIVAFNKVIAFGKGEFIGKLANACLYHEGVWTPSEAKALQPGGPEKVAHALHFIDMAVSRRMTHMIMQAGWAIDVENLVLRVEEE